MKRSKMIERIIQHVYTISTDDLILTSDDANQLLSLIEKDGMTPPSIRLDVPESDGNNFIHYKHEWEPENE